jgi:hypothetical protein
MVCGSMSRDVAPSVALMRPSAVSSSMYELTAISTAGCSASGDGVGDAVASLAGTPYLQVSRPVRPESSRNSSL